MNSRDKNKNTRFTGNAIVVLEKAKNAAAVWALTDPSAKRSYVQTFVEQAYAILRDIYKANDAALLAGIVGDTMTVFETLEQQAQVLWEDFEGRIDELYDNMLRSFIS